jgi:transposase
MAVRIPAPTLKRSDRDTPAMLQRHGTKGAKRRLKKLSERGQFLTYKATLQGIPVVAVDPRNTILTSRGCGSIHKDNRKTQALCRLRPYGRC